MRILIAGVPPRSLSSDPRDGIRGSYSTVSNRLSCYNVANVRSSYGKTAFNVITRVTDIIYYYSQLRRVEHYRGEPVP